MYNKKWHQEYYKNNKEKIKSKSKITYGKNHIIKSREEKFKEKLKEKHNDRYTLLEPYIDYETNILFRCNVCNHEWKPKPRKILGESNCPNCAIIQKTTTEEKFTQELTKIHSDKLSLISNFINYSKEVNVKCNVCNYNWWVKSSHLIHSKSSCPKCADKENHINQTKSHIQFLIDVFNIHKNTLTIEGKYINAKTRINVKCNICNKSWDVVANSLLRGVGCPICKQSKGEQKIENYLKNNTINYIRQHKFDNCKHKQVLFFDFAIFENNNLQCLIEFDGIQHFKPIEYFGGLKEFKENKKRDEVKNNYCMENNIKLLRIPYNNINKVDEILNRFLVNQ